MNKKLLLLAGVLTVVSSSTMAQPVERVLSSKNTDTDFDQKTNSVYVSLKDDIRDIYRIQFEKKDDKYFGISSNKITAELINMEYKYYDNVGGHYTNFSANGMFSNLNNNEDNLSAFSSLSAGNFNVYRNWGDSISLKDNGFSVYNYDKNLKEHGTILRSTGLDNGGFKIINVAKGENDTDAVNVKQLKDYFNDNRTIVKAGDNITVTEDSGTYTVSTAKDLTDMNSVNLNDGNSESHYTVKGIDMTYRGDFEYHTQYNYDGMHIKVNDGDNQPINNEVSVTDKGLNNGNNKIINVSRGEKDTDAVNVSQLKEINKKVDDNTKVIENHESRITDLEHKTVDVGRNALERANHYTDLQVNKGVAKASALAGLKYLDYNPKDKWSFATSVGHYRNANAVAVGAAYQPNENTMVHGGITVDGKVAYNLGVSVKTGGQKYINKYELADQVKQLQSDNALLREELNELRSMIEKK